MTFQPVLPLSGYAGWRFLARTAERQQDLVAEAPITQRETREFRARVGDIKTIDDLMSDRTLLKVSLGAFGLEADLPNKAFVRKILESPPNDPRALANRLADKRYLDFAKTFGFQEPGGPFTGRSGFADRIVGSYETRNFEVAVGAQNESMRLALTTERELSDLANRTSTPDGLWFNVMGNPPLRKVFETALGLPASFGALDLDRQLTTFREKTERVLGNGDIAQFASQDKREELIRLFLVRSQVNQSRSLNSGSVALTMLQSIPRPPSLFG